VAERALSSWEAEQLRLDAGVGLRDVQIAARHADPRTTMRYDRARQNLDRHLTRRHGRHDTADERTQVCRFGVADREGFELARSSRRRSQLIRALSDVR